MLMLEDGRFCECCFVGVERASWESSWQGPRMRSRGGIIQRRHCSVGAVSMSSLHCLQSLTWRGRSA
jgi:hypothetical protein